VKIKHVPPIGQLTARLAICGEAPGREEEAQGIPFVPWAPSGAKLMQLAHNAGLVRADMYLTNVIKTRPPNNNISTFFSEGSFTALGERYRRELLDELQAVESPVVLAVGYVAMAALTTERRPIHLMRGSPLINQQLNKIIIPTLHPAGIMRSGQHMQYHLIEWDIRNALALAAEGGISALPSPNYVLDPSFETAMAWLAELPSLPEFAFDIETSSNELTHISFTRALDDVISIPLGKFNPAQRKSILNGIQTALAAPGPRKITQNGNYDTFFLKWHCNIETDLSTLDDAMVANSVLFPQLAPASAPDAATGKSLAMLASLWGREVYYKDDGEITKFDGDSLGYQLYNAKDSAVVHRCWRRLKTFLDADPAFRYTYDFTMARLPAIQAMQTNGFRVDRRGLALARAAILAELTELSAELNALAQPRLRLQLDAELDTLRDRDLRRVDVGEREIVPRQDFVEVPVGAAVHILRDDDVVARFEERRDGADRGHARGEREGGRAAFNRRDVALERHPRGILRAGVLVALVLAELVLHVGGRLIDGGDDGAGRRRRPDRAPDRRAGKRWGTGREVEASRTRYDTLLISPSPRRWRHHAPGRKPRSSCTRSSARCPAARSSPASG